MFYHDRCVPDSKPFVRKAMRFQFDILSYRHNFGEDSASSSATARKTKGYFDELDSSKVRTRHCAVWDPSIGLHGAWTTEGVKTVHVDETVATCYATKMGSFAVVAEIEDAPYRADDEDWLFIFKMVGYAMSIVCLIAFAGVVLSSPYLWEMFHTLGLHLACCLLLATIIMMVSELDAVRDDIVICAAVGCLINFFYIAAAGLITMESYAIFRAIVSGVIGGRTMVYLCLGYSLPFLLLGFNVFQHLDLMGTEPSCFVSWDNSPLWTFLGPMAGMAALSVVFMSIVVCNMHTPAMRKESIVQELGSVAKGMLVLVILFAVTWAFAPLAYVHFDGAEMPDFYPAFQVMNSFSGVYVFVLLGLCSARFRTVITGNVMHRVSKKKMVQKQQQQQ